MSKIFADQGTVNIILQQLGFDPIHFLTDGKIARVMVILINIWVGVPYSMLATTGILMNIPSELYESARIDGAGPVLTFRKITLPYILFVTKEPSFLIIACVEPPPSKLNPFTIPFSFIT